MTPSVTTATKGQQIFEQVWAIGPLDYVVRYQCCIVAPAILTSVLIALKHLLTDLAPSRFTHAAPQLANSTLPVRVVGAGEANPSGLPLGIRILAGQMRFANSLAMFFGYDLSRSRCTNLGPCFLAF